MMKSKEFVRRLRDAAENYRTLYVMGCFGAPMTEKNKARYTQNQEYNKKPERTAMINAASSDTFGFDCVCLIKGILWGWDGDVSANYGGAKYCSNDVPDIGTNSIIGKCSGVSAEFGAGIVPGELLWMEGHVGVYVGDGLAVECTPAWGNGVQITAVGNLGKKAGYNSRTWTKHGKLPYVDYSDADAPAAPAAKTVSVTVPQLSRGAKSGAVSAMQALLNLRMNARLDVDGEFGTQTDAAVKSFQTSRALTVDGVCGRDTWTVLLGE